MHVLATAGHVDHGKSTLVRALTGMEPDRWAEERRRGMTIGLGFAWTTLPGGETVAFVDVPGHERFVPTMLAGAGPVPAVLFVVAADEGWRAQSSEHLAALHSLGVRHGLLVLTRTDLADADALASSLAGARRQIAGTALHDMEHVCVSSSTGAGLGELRSALARLVAGLPAPDPTDAVRLWVDRSFIVRGAGTVVTGTLGAGTLRVGDRLTVSASGAEVRVRGLQCLAQEVDRAGPVARVAVNLRGVDHDDVRRGHALLARDAWITTDVVDVRLVGDPVDAPHARLVLHAGTAAVPVRVRPLAGTLARLRLDAALPLRIGDRVLLREPSNDHAVHAVTVLDPDPPPLLRRGDAARRAAGLARPDEPVGDGTAELRRRGVVTRRRLRLLGVRGPLPEPVVGDWLVDPALRPALTDRVAAAVSGHRREHPLEQGVAVGAAAAAAGLPDAALVAALLPPGVHVRDGRVHDDATPLADLPPGVRAGVDAVHAELSTAPFAAPPAHRLAELGLGRRELAAASRAGALLVLPDGVVLLPDAAQRAAAALAAVPAPFTVSQARQAWSTSRRVALPLLALLDRLQVTEPLDDGTRRLTWLP